MLLRVGYSEITLRCWWRLLYKGIKRKKMISMETESKNIQDFFFLPFLWMHRNSYLLRCSHMWGHKYKYVCQLVQRLMMKKRFIFNNIFQQYPSLSTPHICIIQSNFQTMLLHYTMKVQIKVRLITIKLCIYWSNKLFLYIKL